MIEKLERFIDRLTGVFVGVCVLGLFGSAKAVTLAWTASPESNVTGYKLYCGATPGHYTKSKALGRVTQVELPNDQLPVVTTYFALTAVNIFGEESGFSNEVVCTHNVDITIKLLSNSQGLIVYWTHPAYAVCDVLEESSDLKAWIAIDESLYQIISSETRAPVSFSGEQRFFRVSRPEACL
jgi:hypothetical protein